MGFRYQKSKLGIENEAPFSAIYFTFSARNEKTVNISKRV